MSCICIIYSLTCLIHKLARLYVCGCARARVCEIIVLVLVCFLVLLFGSLQLVMCLVFYIYLFIYACINFVFFRGCVNFVFVYVL